MSGTTLLAPLRFISLMLNIILSAELLETTSDNDTACGLNYDAGGTTAVVSCMIALTCFETFGLMTGLSVFQDLQSLFSLTVNFLSVFLILFFQMDVWCSTSLW